MTLDYSAAFGTISQSEHEAKSIRRFIHTWPGFGNFDIWMERAKSLRRPALGLVEVSRPQPRNRGRILQGSEADWQIDVMGPDSEPFNYWATKKITDSLQGALWQVQLIPLYYFNWRYPAVKAHYIGDQTLSEVNTVTRLVGVVAEDREGGTSLAGLSQVEVPEPLQDGDAVEIVWPEYPLGSGWAAKFRIFYGTEANLSLWRVLDAEPYEWARTSLVLTGGPDDGLSGSPPETSTIFARRFLRLTQISSRMLEHPEREGVWNGVITFTSICDVSRLRLPGLEAAEVPELMQEITTRLSTRTS